MPQNKIYVGNIAYAAELEEIQSLFAPYGEIEDIAMAMDKETEAFRGFAIVMMPNVEEAARAIAGVDGHQLRGRRLVVNQAVKKSALVKENATQSPSRIATVPLACRDEFARTLMLGLDDPGETRGVVEAATEKSQCANANLNDRLILY